MRHHRTPLAGLLVVVACQTAPELPVYRQLELVNLETSLGAPLAAADLDGRVHVVDFIFTSCEMACPLMTAQMKRLYDDFQGDEGVRFLSITTDPATDTVTVLHDYALRQGVDEQRWIFARAPIEELTRLSEKEFLLAASNLPAGHSLKFVVVDAERRIRGFYDSGNAEELEQLGRDVQRLAAGRE